MKLDEKNMIDGFLIVPFFNNIMGCVSKGIINVELW